MKDIPLRKIKTEEVNELPAEDKLLDFVEEQVSKMRGYAKFNSADGQPGFFELNRALSEHQIVWLGLVSLNAMAKVELAKAKVKFDDWYSDKYIAKRNELNPRTLSSTKWYSTKEIEMYIRSENKEEYHRLDSERTIAELKVAHIRRLMDGWLTQQFTLSRLSKNVEAEMSDVKQNGEGGDPMDNYSF